MDYGRTAKSDHPVLPMLLSSPLVTVTEKELLSTWGMHSVYLTYKMKLVKDLSCARLSHCNAFELMYYVDMSMRSPGMC